MSFIHLRVHTEYSLSDSIIRVNELVDHVAKMGMPGVAVTDPAESALRSEILYKEFAEGIETHHRG